MTSIYSHGVVTDGPHGIQPVDLTLIGTSEAETYSGFTITLLDLSGNSLNQRIAELGSVNGAHQSAAYFEEKDVRYALLAGAYHLEQVSLRYRDIAELFERLHPAGTALRGNVSDARVYFEIDAFLGAARRSYEQVRRVVWKHLGSGTRPRSIDALLSADIDLPTDYRLMLATSWREHGIKLKSYRDCLAHNDPLNHGNTTCWINTWGDRWGVTVRLPSNPEVKSRSQFEFESGPDALDYCHALLCHLADVAEATEALPAVRHHLNTPVL